MQADDDRLPLQGLPVTVLTGDVTNPATLNAAFAGADVVFHLAGIVSITRGREALVHRVNVEGTRAVVEACVAQKVRRLVYTSSVHALVEPAGPTMDESAGYDESKTEGVYGKSKAEASRLVRDAALAGRLDAVLVLPSGVVGPFDFRLSEMGQFLRVAGRGRLPAVVRGGYEWVDVRDVAQGHVLAAERGKSGESYLLSAGRMTMGEIARLVCRAAGVKPPLLEVPLGFVQLLATASPAWEWVSRERALLTPYALHQLAVPFTIDTKKARAELDFTTRPLEESFTDAWRWLATAPNSPLTRELKAGPARTLRPSPTRPRPA